MLTSKNLTCLLLIVTTIVFSTATLQAQRAELVERRTANSRTFRNPDNSLTTEICAGLMHYRDTNDDFQPIDNRIVPSGSEYDFEVTQGVYHAYFKADLQSEWPVVFESKDGANLKMKLIAIGYLNSNSKEYTVIQTADNPEPQVNNNEIVFPNVFDNIDLKYKYGDLRLKEEILVSQAARDALPDPRNFGFNANNSYLVFITQLDLDGAPEVFANNEKVRRKDFDGETKLTFRDIRGDIKFLLPVDWAFRDADRDTLGEDIMLKIHKRLIHTDEGHILLSGVKLSDLREMPSGTVVFDPQVVLPDTDEGKDTLIYFKNSYPDYSNYNYGITPILQLLRSDFVSYHIRRSLLSFDVEASVPTGNNVIGAFLELYCNDIYQGTGSAAGGGTVFPANIDVYRILVDWDEGPYDGGIDEASWDRRKENIDWETEGMERGVDYDGHVEATVEVEDASAEDTWLQFNVTDLVQGWVDTPSLNYGMLVKLYADSLSVYRSLKFDSVKAQLAVNARSS